MVSQQPAVDIGLVMRLAIVGADPKPYPEVMLKLSEFEQVVVYSGEATESAILSHAAGADTLITWGRITTQLIDQLPQLRAISLLATGIDQSIAEGITQDWLAARGISVFNCPDAATDAVAEFSLAGLLSGLWSLWGNHEALFLASVQAIGFAGAEVGIVGLGHIGRKLSSLLVPSGFRVLVYTRTPPEPEILPPGVELCGLPELCRRSRGIAICSSMNKSSLEMFRAEHFALLAPECVLVNAARARIFDLRALGDFLRRNQQARCLIDGAEQVRQYAPELMRLPNCFCTPHIAAHTVAAFGRYLNIALDNLVLWSRGSPVNRVDLSDSIQGQ